MFNLVIQLFSLKTLPESNYYMKHIFSNLVKQQPNNNDWMWEWLSQRASGGEVDDGNEPVWPSENVSERQNVKSEGI